eukprot:jgi/Orpsp1_1/1190507/evm.model.d7180000079446.1
MNIYYILIIVLWTCTQIEGRNSRRIKKRNNRKTRVNKLNEFKTVTSQSLLLQSPSSYCQCHQGTVYFKNQNSGEAESTKNTTYPVTLSDKQYYVGGIQKFSRNPNSKFTYECLRETLATNNIIRLFNRRYSNLFWYNTANPRILKKFNKYQRYNHFLKFNEITRKDLLYRNYERFQQKFPEDFTYLPETYTYQQMSHSHNKFENYEVSEDNLWLVKPKGLSRGRGIHFLEDTTKISSRDIITKYISDPLLIEGRKFDLRIYLLVTGHDPLKIYMYEDCFARLSTEEFNLDLKGLSNLYRHLTNVSINKRNSSKKSFSHDDFIWPIAKVKDYLKEKYGIEFGEVWEEIEDLAIKSLITMNHIEIEKEKDFDLATNNLFELYGIDILLDRRFKSWLLEINLSPDLSLHGDYERELKYKLMRDLMNIIGLVPYSHVDGTAMEGECEYKDSVEEAVQQSICEFTRPLGEFKRIFPRKDRLDYYKPFFEKVTANNKALWNEIQNIDLE